MRRVETDILPLALGEGTAATGKVMSMLEVDVVELPEAGKVELPKLIEADDCASACASATSFADIVQFGRGVAETLSRNSPSSTTRCLRRALLKVRCAKRVDERGIERQIHTTGKQCNNMARAARTIYSSLSRGIRTHRLATTCKCMRVDFCR